MADPTPAEQQLDWGAITTQIMGALAIQFPDLTSHKARVAAHAEGQGAMYSVIYDLAVALAYKTGSALHQLEEPFFPIIAGLVTPIIAGLFGAEVSEADFRGRMAHGSGAHAGQTIVEGLMRAITGDGAGPIEPSDAGSRRIAGAAVSAALESNFNAIATEMLSHMLPEVGPHWEGITELPESIIRALGVSRLVRRALTPLVNATCTTPATWHVNKLHRPTMLGASTLAKQIARHPDLRETWLEDLRREGYSEARIEALLNEQAKFHSVADLALLIRTGQWSEGDAVQHLRDQGYDDAVARVELLIEKIKGINAFEKSIASDAVTAFGNGNIDESTLGGMVTGATISEQEKAQYVEHAHAKRILNRRGVTPSEAAAAVEAKVLSFRDYRLALERDGRDDEAVTVLELLLRARLDKAKAIEDHRAELEAERAADKAARLAAAAAKKAETDAKLALKQRGSMSDLEAAYIRGLIPLARVQEVYDATYDGETASVLSDLVQARRADYVAQQEAAAAAKARGVVRGIDVGALQKAVLTGVLTLDEFSKRLTDQGYSAADAGLLTATMGATLKQRAAADAAHDAAAAAAKVKHVDLATLELLVRRGHRSLADYRSALSSLGYDDGSQAALVERLQILIDDDAAAAATRAAAAAKLRIKGLSLDQFRRAVLLGVRSIEEFATFLLQQGFGAVDVQTLVAELRADVDQAEAARARRAEADRRSQPGLAPLSDVRRAARLGLIDLSVYTDRLTLAGMTPGDIDLEVDLLTVEIADTAAARRRHDELVAQGGDRELARADVAKGVLDGLATIAQYETWLRQAGYTPDDTGLLVAELQYELDAKAAKAGGA